MGKNIFAEIKDTFTSLIAGIFSSDNVPARKKEETTCFLRDEFIKDSQPEPAIIPVTRKVWVDGRAFTVAANSPQELELKIKKLTEKSIQELLLETAKKPDDILFRNSYTEEQQVDENEWLQRKDVWIYEYNPV